MTKLVWYGVGALAVGVAAAALIKKKPARLANGEPVMMIGPGGARSPKIYQAVKGDKPSVIAARFGTTQQALSKVNGTMMYLARSSAIKLPPGVADMGPRPGAQGKVS